MRSLKTIQKLSSLGSILSKIIRLVADDFAAGWKIVRSLSHAPFKELSLSYG